MGVSGGPGGGLRVVGRNHTNHTLLADVLRVVVVLLPGMSLLGLVSGVGCGPVG